LGSNLQYIDNGWYRYSWTVQAQQTAALNSTSFVIFGMGLDSATFNWTGDGTSGMYIWGAQKEISTAVTSYQGIGATTLVTPNFARREDRTGNMYVTNSYDEFTGAPVVDGNLKCWLDASQTASYPGTGTIWYDLSNNGSNAVLNGVSYNNTTVAMNFNGGSISIPVGNVANITTTSAVTASVWFNSTTADTSYRRLISRDSYPNQNWYIEYNGAAASVGNVFAYSGTASTGNTPITSNIWYNLTMTATASNVCLYKNGTLTVYNGTATTFLANASAIGIGADANGGTQFLGNISQVMVYNRALSPDEVAQNFNALRRRYNI